jgi:hypothetical protein
MGLLEKSKAFKDSRDDCQEIKLYFEEKKV